jgi:hypothetical protein
LRRSSVFFVFSSINVLYYIDWLIDWLICICWTIPVSLGWSQLGHGEWSFWYVVRFCLPVFYPGFLHQFH